MKLQSAHVVSVLAMTLGLACDIALADPVQWTLEDGGNGHYYERVVHNKEITWPTARALAESHSYNGMQGHLVTVTSAEETSFLVDSFSEPHFKASWIGGIELDGEWTWVTGEEFSYTNWHPNGEPVGGIYMGNYVGPQHDWTWWAASIASGSRGYYVEFEPVANNAAAQTPEELHVEEGIVVQQPGPKRPVPDDAAQQKAEKDIQEVYADDFAEAKTPQKKNTLAKKLLQVATKTTDDRAVQFVLLVKVRELATEFGNVDLTLSAIDETSKRFTIDPLDWKADALALIEQRATLTKSGKRASFTKETLFLVEQAIAEDQYEHATELAAIATRVAKKAGDLELAKHAVESKDDVASLKDEYTLVQDAEAIMEDDPTNADANLTVGRYLCFSKADWDAGLLMLAFGSDPELKTLAGQELKGPDGVIEQIDIGDDWWRIGEDFEGRKKQNIQEHAAKWYRIALPQLAGFHKNRIDQRLKALVPRPPFRLRGARLLGPRLRSGRRFLHASQQESYHPVLSATGSLMKEKEIVHPIQQGGLMAG